MSKYSACTLQSRYLFYAGLYECISEVLFKRKYFLLFLILELLMLENQLQELLQRNFMSEEMCEILLLMKLLISIMRIIIFV